MSVSLLELWVIAVLVATLSGAQNDTAQFPACTDDNLRWSFNDQNRSPCEVTQALYLVCTPDGGPLLGLPKGFHYAGPDKGFSTPCDCSSVYYSTLSACALCQGLDLDHWSDYVLNCSTQDIVVGSFPRGVPPDISVPLWAFQNVQPLDLFEPSAAKKLAEANDDDIVSGTAPPSSSSSLLASVTSGVSPESGSDTVTVTVSTAPGPTASNSTRGSDNDAGTGHKTNVGAIVGGVIGGLAFIGIVVTGAFFFIKRRQSGVKHDRNSPHSPKPFNSNNTISSFDGETRSTTTPFSPNGGVTLPLMQPRLYDPSDPSTFPATPAPMMQQYGYQQPRMTVTPTSSSSNLYTNSSGFYRGIPEV